MSPCTFTANTVNRVRIPNLSKIEGDHGPIHIGARVLFNGDFKLSLSVYVYDGVISKKWIGGMWKEVVVASFVMLFLILP
jgi:hypothetical protein